MTEVHTVSMVSRMPTSHGKATQGRNCVRPNTAILFPLVTGKSCRDLDTELYGETSEKDSWARIPPADPSIAGHLGGTGYRTRSDRVRLARSK